MAPQDPPRDDDTPENDAPETEAEIHDEGDAPRVTSTDKEGAVDAEIVEEIAAETEAPEDRADDDGMAMEDDVPAAHADTPKEMREDEAAETGDEPPLEAANENKPSGSGLAAPFAIIVGALLVIAALVYFLNNDDSPAPLEDGARPDLFATEGGDSTAPAQPITDNDQKLEEVVFADLDDEPTPPVEDAETAPFVTADVPEEPATEEPVADTEEADTAETATADNMDEPAAKDAAEAPQSAASETVTALVNGGEDEAQAEDDNLAIRRSALIARAAERNRARREAREGDSEESLTEDVTSDLAATLEQATEETAEDIAKLEEDIQDSAGAIVAETEEELSEEVSHAGTSVATEIIAAAVTPNEVITEEEAVEAETPDGDQLTEEQDSRVEMAEQDEVSETTPSVVVRQGLEARAEEVIERPVAELEPATPPAPPAPDLEVIKSDLKADVLAETEQVIDQKLQQTEQEVRALRTELTEQQRLANERLAAITRKLDSLETSEINAARQSTLLLALSDLDNGMKSGEPFLKELENVERIAPSARSLSPLRAHATTGLPTDTELRAAYSVAARQALSSAKREDADGPLSRLGANITGLFSVRKTGTVEGDTPSAVIARADDSLNSGDLQGAIDELETLEGPAREAFADWISQAAAKADAQRRIEAMERAASARAG